MEFWKQRDEYILKLVNWIPYWIKPNHISIFRIILIIPITYLLIEQYFIWSLLLFLFAFVTDMVDGALARSRNQISKFGKIIDPIADKTTYLIFFILIAYQKINYLIFIFTIILEVDIVLIGLIFWLVMKFVKIGIKEEKIGANFIGKIKTPIQIVGIIILIFALKFGWTVLYAEIFLGIGAILAFINLLFHTLNIKQFKIIKN
ncbi:MAG: CDP-alcohol phosphatidyltransferase family protein [Patescibacteria group bacterium]